MGRGVPYPRILAFTGKSLPPSNRASNAVSDRLMGAVGMIDVPHCLASLGTIEVDYK